MSESHRLGAVVQAGDAFLLRFVRQLRHPPERVWQALTRSEDLRHWMPTDMIGERRAGAAIQLPFWSPFVAKYGIPAAALPGEILVWEPPSVFEWMWDTDRLRFELEPTADGTQLTFTTWLSEKSGTVHRTAAGYHNCFDALEDRLDDTLRVPLIDREQAELEAIYAERVAAQLGAE